jgi:hypothetical protein
MCWVFASVSAFAADGCGNGTSLPSHGGAALLRAPTSSVDEVAHSSGRPEAA